jgi:hypothetical protein
MKRFRKPSPGVILGVIAVVLALGGTAVAASNLKLANFEPSSRDRLAGTGVIQYASQTYDTGGTSPDLKVFSVKCAAEKKATAGGFKWLGTPPIPTDYQFVDAYPTGGGFTVRLRVTGATGANKQLAVYANCVKSRKQDGTPPS